MAPYILIYIHMKLSISGTYCVFYSSLGTKTELKVNAALCCRGAPSPYSNQMHNPCATKVCVLFKLPPVERFHLL